MGVVVTHSIVTGAAADPSALVDGPAWDAQHVITGLAPSATVDTTNASNITSGTLPVAQMQAAAGTAAPIMDGTAAVGTSTLWAHQDHVHPTDTSRAPLASPALTGTPTAPTAAALTNNTQLATTAYTDGAVSVEKTRALAAEALLSPLASPALTGTPTAPTATAGDNSTKVATTAFLATALTNLPIDGAAWTAYTPTVTFSSGSGSATGRYKKIGKTVCVQVTITCATSGALSTVSAPLPVSSAGSQYYLVGREAARTGIIWFAEATAPSAINAANGTNNSAAMTAGDVVILTGIYETT